MSGKQAKILSENQQSDLLLYASCTRHPIRNRVLALLSIKAGLRAGEIAKLTWNMVLDASGGVASSIELQDYAAKKQSGRRIPINPVLQKALAAWRALTDGVGPVI